MGVAPPCLSPSSTATPTEARSRAAYGIASVNPIPRRTDVEAAQQPRRLIRDRNRYAQMGPEATTSAT